MKYFVDNLGPKHLRKLLESKDIITAPGCHDGISARILDSFNFDALYITGHGISLSVLGQSDLGMTTASEVVNRARDMVSVVEKPMILDIDTGYGGVLNIQRTVMEVEKAGISAIQIEDQVWPKKCGHMKGKKVVACEEMLSRIEAVKAARNTELVIIARTDARAVYGIDEAIRRANKYLEHGADIAFIDGPQSVDDLKRMSKEVNGWILANYVEGGLTPLLKLSEYQDLGFKLIIYPLSMMYASVKAMMELASELESKGDSEDFAKQNRMTVFDDFNKIVELDKMYDIEGMFSKS